MKYLKQTTLVAGLLLAGSIFAAESQKANLQLTMLTQVNPPALALWDLTNAAQNDKGDIDVAKIDAGTWAKLLDAGKTIEAGGRTLATGSGVIAALPGAKLQDESAPGASKAADVQRYVDAKPAEFRKHAQQLQRTGAAIIAAVNRRDGKDLTRVANELDQVCEDCHMAFWYPQQKVPR